MKNLNIKIGYTMYERLPKHYKHVYDFMQVDVLTSNDVRLLGLFNDAQHMMNEVRTPVYWQLNVFGSFES